MLDYVRKGTAQARARYPRWAQLQAEITPARLNYDGDYGATKIMVPNPGAKPSLNGRTYVTDRLSVVIKTSPCSDGMSDRRYPFVATIALGGETFEGCGYTDKQPFTGPAAP